MYDAHAENMEKSTAFVRKQTLHTKIVQ